MDKDKTAGVDRDKAEGLDYSSVLLVFHFWHVFEIIVWFGSCVEVYGRIIEDEMETVDATVQVRYSIIFKVLILPFSMLIFGFICPLAWREGLRARVLISTGI